MRARALLLSELSATHRGVQTRRVARRARAGAGAEVVQLYIQFPPDAGEPRLVLGAFAKTQVLRPSETATVTLTLHERDNDDWWMHVAGCPGSHVVIHQHAAGTCRAASSCCSRGRADMRPHLLLLAPCMSLAPAVRALRGEYACIESQPSC